MSSVVQRCPPPSSMAKRQRIEESELLYHSALSTVYDLDSFTKYGISRLPRELVNIILRELWNDRLTLQMCSLVCKSWLRECRTYLWQTTHITDAVYPTYGMYNRSNRIQAFTKFLAHTASLGFCSSIRILRVGGDEKVSEPHQRTRINVATIAALLEKLPHLQVMELTRVVLGHTVAKPKTQKFTLSTLSIHMVGCSVDEGSGIAEVLGLFDDIRTLEASYIDIPGALEPPSMALIPPNFQLNEVRLKGCLRGQDKPEVRRLSTVHRLLELLRNLPSTPRLRSITVQCGVMAEVRALGRCLQQAGRYVQNLGLEMYELTREHIDPESVVQALHLEECIHLQTLRLSIFPNCSDPQRNATATACLSYLIGSLPSSLRRLDIIMGYNDMLMTNLTMLKLDTLADAPWSRLNRLETLTFALMPHRSDPTVEMAAKTHLTTQFYWFNHRGLLSFDTKSFWY